MPSKSRRPIVRGALRADIPLLVDLFRRHYAQYKPEAYFEWQFFSAEAPAVLTVAIDDAGGVVGSFGYMRRALSDGRYAGQVMDMLLDGDFRGHGLFETMAEHAFSAYPEVSVRTVLSNERGTAAVTRRLGWKVVASVPVYRANPSAESGPPPFDRGPCPEASRLCNRYDDVLERWRFSAHPFNRYHRLDAASLHGYVKLFVDPSDASRRIGDILYVTPGCPEACVSWLRTALAWFRAERAGVCGLWSLPGAPVAAAALQAGFEWHPQARWLCAQAVDGDASGLLSQEHWDVCAADAEFY